jgi:crotonobetainyl-CoA:carnitine CoA-transferase CaiB-like acyl-CoA transferase
VRVDLADPPAVWDGGEREDLMGLGSVGNDVAQALRIDTDALASVEDPSPALPWRSNLPVARLATDSVGLASLAVELLLAARGGRPAGRVRADGARVAASFTSERVLRLNGEPPAVWAPLSGFWPTSDGWVRTHANYAHHERALRTLLALPENPGRDAVATAIAERSAVGLESQAAERGAIVGAVRSPGEWAAHPQHDTIAATPIVETERFEGAPPRPWRGEGDTPLRGIRVLDLTRVLAGPVAARDLAFAGADVLRVDSPLLPETGWIHLDTGQGKRSTLLNLRETADRDAFERLLADADVVLTGYRPGALRRFGLEPGSIAERHPGLVMAQVSAWGYRGAWAQRRGFDSIVQAVTGIAMRESADGASPGVLPAQALDHSTGHFLAAAILVALLEQRRAGGSISVRMSLAGVAQALLASGDAVPAAAEIEPPSRERELPGPTLTSLRYAPPVLGFTGAPADYARVGDPWGVDAPTWASNG